MGLPVESIAVFHKTPWSGKKSLPVKAWPATSAYMWKDSRLWLLRSNQTNQQKTKRVTGLSFTAGLIQNLLTRRNIWKWKISAFKGFHRHLNTIFMIQTVVRSSVVRINLEYCVSQYLLLVCTIWCSLLYFTKHDKHSHACRHIKSHFEFFQVKKQITIAITRIWPHCSTSDGGNKVKIL